MVATLSPELVRSALDSSPDAMVLIDTQGRILFGNQQLISLFGYQPEEIRGQPVELLVPERFRSAHANHRAGFTTERRARPMGVGLDLHARRKDGSEFPVEISLSPIQDDSATLVAAVIRDVTERKRAQQELIAARESADRANQAKSRFLATASHDLRQPLQSLSLLNGTLRRLVSQLGIPSLTPAEGSLADRSVAARSQHLDAAEALAHQDKAIETMSRLLNALLDISKLESGAVKPEKTDFSVASLFEELRHEFAAVAAQKGLELLVISTTAESIHSDRALVGQILRNLVSNAIKYTRAGTVRLHSVGAPAGIRIEVTDTGIGIAPDQLHLIYDEFYQVGVPTNSAREGYGLGLSIVQRLITLLELRLEVHSEIGKGSVFVLELPSGNTASAKALTPRRASGSVPQQSTAAQVLLVEDDPAVRDATRMLLKVEGYRVLTAGSLAEARSQAKSVPRIDLLVTDYHLSDGETGTQVISALREDLGTQLKAVLITGDTSSAVRELQRDERLRLARKPIRAEELLALLKSLLAS